MNTKKLCIPLLLCCSGITPGLTFAQSADTDTAAERAKLADQRIRTEADRRAQEALERQQQTATETRRANGGEIQVTAGTTQSHEDPAPAATTATPGTDSGDTRSADDDTGITEALNQLRELGELRDAGYVTEEEFRRIKKRILDSRF